MLTFRKKKIAAPFEQSQSNTLAHTNNQQTLSKKIYVIFDLIEDILNFLRREIGLGVASFIALQFAKGAEKGLRSSPGLVALLTFIQMPLLFYKLYYYAFASEEDIYTRSFYFTMTVLAIGFSIVSILSIVGLLAVSAPILLLIGALRGVAENGLGLCVALYQRYGYYKEHQRIHSPLSTHLDQLTLLNNEQETNLKIISRINNLCIANITLASTILLFTPAAFIGGVMLAIISAVAFADILLNHFTNKNTLQWLVHAFNESVKQCTGYELLRLTPIVQPTLEMPRKAITNRPISTHAIPPLSQTSSGEETFSCKLKLSASQTEMRTSSRLTLT